MTGRVLSSHFKFVANDPYPLQPDGGDVPRELQTGPLIAQTGRLANGVGRQTCGEHESEHQPEWSDHRRSVHRPALSPRTARSERPSTGLPRGPQVEGLPEHRAGGSTAAPGHPTGSPASRRIDCSFDRFGVGPRQLQPVPNAGAVPTEHRSRRETAEAEPETNGGRTPAQHDVSISDASKDYPKAAQYPGEMTAKWIASDTHDSR